ncbi:MAG: EAL domain-containing protein [Pseudomonadota bacterium]
MILPAKDCDFSPYAQLVAALLPRAGGISLFEPGGELRWTSEDTIGPGANKLVRASAVAADSSDEAGERTLSAEGEPLYLFWLRDEARALVAVFSVSWKSGESEPRTFAYVHAMLRPVLACLRRELMLRARVGEVATAASTGQDADADLQVLLSAGETDQQDGAGDGVRNLLQSVNKHMQCEFAALMVPERHLVAVVKAEGREVDTSALAKIHRQLLSLATVRSDAALLNAPDSLPGVSLPFRVLSCPLRNRAGRPAGVLALFRSSKAPEFRRRDAMLADLLARRGLSLVESSYDTLSGLLTQRVFDQRARILLTQRAAGPNTQWTSLYIDADRMHAVNDSHGMHVGDQLLARLGELIRSRLAPGALAARLNGDRFAILLPVAEAEATGFAEALRAGVAALTSAHLGVNDAGFTVSISLGVAAIDVQRDLPQALAAAETACKLAKQRGRNRVELFHAGEVPAAATGDDTSEAALRAVISDNRLRLDAQRITAMPGAKSGLPRFELLLRVIDDSGAAVGPGRFISAAARFQLLPEVDRWVVQEAVRLLKPHAAMLNDKPVVFSINLSAQSLAAQGFADFVIAQIQSSGVPPEAFCFELAESMVVANVDKAEVLMKRLREAGCSMALDHFGTGMSSLALLRTLPVDVLKIDGSFVRDVLRDPRAESMVQAIAQLAHTMNLVTVAQHVETEEIRLRVGSLGVDFAQGFSIGRPAAFADAVQELATLAAVDGGHTGEVAAQGEDVVSAELQQELLAAGIELADQDEDALSRMQKVLAGYDHSESTLYQRKAAR